MATKDKKPAVKKDAATVTRITSSASAKKATPKSSATKKPTTKKTSSDTPKKRNFFIALGEYFSGAWYELKQVNWPTRRATWSLTGALIAFTGFFVALILLLDMVFQKLFELMLG